MHQPDESNYTQQHLANERTYLAWIRTSLAMIGIGFLAPGIIFRTQGAAQLEHLIAAIGGIGAVLMGGCVFGIATHNYFHKRRGINRGEFRSPQFLIWFVVAALGFIILLLIVLIIRLMF
ncbi:DUF202 domain-containing protein [Paenibacillus campi]|uniref:YidH family protein n=1 Tax=Paenibacillus campi TaxID=3106031 RepID=UPI002AFE0789|nr:MULTISPECIES: DUF202 domain-containing protein [unclassified Paenibacillus]